MSLAFSILSNFHTVYFVIKTTAIEDHVFEQIRKFGGCRRYAFEVITVQSKKSWEGMNE